MEDWSQEERDLAAETIYRFVFRGIYRLHVFNGDPHPGNYLFRPGGQVTFLDFGLVKRYTPDEVALFEALIRSMVFDHDIAAFRRLIEAHDVLRPDALTDDDCATTSATSTSSCCDDRVFTVDPEYASETVRMYFDPSSPYAEVAQPANVPPAFVITQRINLGLTRCSAGSAPRRTGAASRRRSGRSSTGRRRHRWAKRKPRGSRRAGVIRPIALTHFLSSESRRRCQTTLFRL